MSLVKKLQMTEKRLAANRRNQNLCHSPVMAERRERIRAALGRFGLDLQAEEAAVRALGEDPAQFQELLKVLWEEWNPVGGLPEGVVIRLARALWLVNRADCMQEGYAVRQALEVSSGRGDRVHARMMRLKITADTLRRLAQSVAHAHYVTTPHDLEMMKNLHQEGVSKDMDEIALALFCQLPAPGTGEDGIDIDQQSRNALRRVKEIFGLSGDAPPAVPVTPASSRAPECRQDAGATQENVETVAPTFRSAYAELKFSATPSRADLPTQSGQVRADAARSEENVRRYPSITPAEWESRERPRHLLENILRRQGEICEAQRKVILKESLTGPSPYERAAEIAPTHPNARLMRRMQDSNFREVRRLTSILLRIKRYQCQMEASGKTAAFHDVLETKWVSV
jgi:hypothetical protein